MTMWENQVEKEHHRKPVPEVFISGEGTLSEAPLTPPSIFPDIPSDLSAAGHGEFLRKRRMLRCCSNCRLLGFLAKSRPKHLCWTCTAAIAGPIPCGPIPGPSNSFSPSCAILCIPLKPATQSGRRRPPTPGQSGR